MPPRVAPPEEQFGDDVEDEDEHGGRWISPDPDTVSLAIQSAIARVLPGGHRVVAIVVQPNDHLFVVRNVPRDEADGIARHMLKQRN
jgi:hypothetical protein